MTAARALRIDEVLAGKYRIVRHIADGGMGAVYEAERLRAGTRVAIKALHPELSRNGDMLRRFHTEAQAASAIGHENIVEILDLGRTREGSLFLVMELLVGQNLAERLQSLGGKMPAARAAHVMAQVLAALEAAHRHGIVHRDLKPENIFLTQRGDDPDFVKVLDFGVSKILTEASGPTLATTGFVLGTPYFMAPEQARGTGVDHRADVYSCGALLYRLLTGRLPFEAPNFNALMFEIASGQYPPPRSLAPEIPPALEAVVTRAMALDPAARFPTAESFRAALVPFAQRPGGPSPAAFTAPVSVAARPSRRRTWIAVAAGLLVGVLGGLFIVHRVRTEGPAAAGAPAPAERATPPAPAVAVTEPPAKTEAAESAAAPPAPSEPPAEPAPAAASAADAAPTATWTFEISPPEAASSATIAIDGEPVDGARAILEIAPDERRKIEVRAKGYKTWRRRRAVEGDRTWKIDLEPRASAPGGSIDL